jgi:hypothetical protein
MDVDSDSDLTLYSKHELRPPSQGNARKMEGSQTLHNAGKEEHSEKARYNIVIRKLKECHTEQQGAIPAIQGHIASLRKVSPSHSGCAE